MKPRHWGLPGIHAKKKKKRKARGTASGRGRFGILPMCFSSCTSFGRNYRLRTRRHFKISLRQKERKPRGANDPGTPYPFPTARHIRKIAMIRSESASRREWLNWET